MLGDDPTIAERVRETGARGEGGDRTLVIDADAEAAVFAELERLHARARASRVSEERGTVDFGSPDVLVVVDPIDGSTNAKRGLPHHSLSIAVADGPTMADVAFGFVHDFGPEEEWIAWRGGRAAERRAPRPGVGERRTRDGRLELLGIESADPRWLREAADELAGPRIGCGRWGRSRSRCARSRAARLDGMVSLRRRRAVDAAAAQLIVREAGGPWPSWLRRSAAAPLDLGRAPRWSPPAPRPGWPRRPRFLYGRFRSPAMLGV